ncbi:MAG: glycosyltransferase family 39 protein [Bacteroidota bacterium]
MEPPSRLARIPAFLWWAVPVGVGLATRLIVCFVADLPWDSVDTRIYGWMARAILEGEPRSFAPNGYPLFLAGLLSVVPSTAIVPVVQSLNVLWGAATVGLTYAIARALDRQPVAALAAMIVAVYPHPINYTRFLLTEVPTTFLLMLALYGVLRAHQTSSWRWSAGAGIVLGLALMLRTALAPVAAGIGILALWMGSVRTLVLPYGVGLVLILGAHSLAVSTGHLASSSNLHVNLLIAIADDPDEVIASAPRFTDAERASAVPAYLRHARETPAAFAGERLRTVWDLWSPWPQDRGAADRPLWQNALLGLRFPLLVVGLAGLALHRRKPIAWLLACPALATTALFAFFFALPRFTFIAEPGLAILCALALAAVVRRHPSRSASA